MLRLLFITDYTETFSYKLLKGITNYSEEKGQWSICRMPSSYKNEIGIPGLLKWAKDWEIDAIIGRFEESDNIDLIRDNGIIVVAQDFKKRFKNIPNITADYIRYRPDGRQILSRKRISQLRFLRTQRRVLV